MFGESFTQKPNTIGKIDAARKTRCAFPPRTAYKISSGSKSPSHSQKNFATPTTDLFSSTYP